MCEQCCDLTVLDEVTGKDSDTFTIDDGKGAHVSFAYGGEDDD